MSSDRYLNKYLVCDNKYYCPYCGKELKREECYEHYDEWYEYSCDCDDAKQERNVMAQIRRLQDQLPKVKYTIKPQLAEKKPWE